MVFTEKIIKDLGLFWQYPVIHYTLDYGRIVNLNSNKDIIQ